jgi:hypothetical protein
MEIKKIITWLPRILSIVFVLFLSLFSFDVFIESYGWQTILGFLIHLLPSFILLAIILISWKYELVGAITFLSFSIFYIFMVGLDRHWSWYVVISLPSAIIGILFLLSWFKNKKSIEI